MGWISIPIKTFRDREPLSFEAFEVWEPEGFTGRTVHLIKSSVAVDRAHRIVYETEDVARFVSRSTPGTGPLALDHQDRSASIERNWNAPNPVRDTTNDV